MMQKYIDCNSCGNEFPEGEIHQITPTFHNCSRCLDKFQIQEEINERNKKNKKSKKKHR